MLLPALFLLTTLPLPPLRAGAAALPITPDLDARPVYLAGYDPGRRARSVHDDVWARALVLEVGDDRLAIVALDLIGWFLSDVEPIRARLHGAGIDHLVVAATHTHSGPDTLGLWGRTPFVTGRDEAYADWVRQRIEQAVGDALAALRPATLRVAQGPVPGLIRDSRPPEVIDDTLSVLAVDGSDGRAVATLTCYPVHPEVLGRESRLLTSDFPHHTREAIETARGGVALHVSGSIGGLLAPSGRMLIDPDTGAPPEDGSLRMMQLYGARLAQDALRLVDEAAPVPVERVQRGTREVDVPLANGYYRLALALRVIGGRPFYTAGRRDDRVAEPLLAGFPRHALGHDLRTEVSVLRLGGVTLACVPGEIYPEITLGRIPDPDPHRDLLDCAREPALLDLLPGEHRIVLGLANDEIGYILPRCQWDEDPPYTFGRTRRPYGEIHSLGPDTAPRILEAFRAICAELGS